MGVTRGLMRLLAEAQVDIRTDSGVEAVENGGVGAVGERIGIAGNRGPELAGDVGRIHWDESPRRVGTGRCHDNIGSNLDLKNSIGRRVWTYGRAEVDFSTEQVDAAHVIQLGRKACGGSSESLRAAVDGGALRALARIHCENTMRRSGGDDYRMIGSGANLEHIRDASSEVESRIAGHTVNSVGKSSAWSGNHVGLRLGLTNPDRQRQREPYN